MQLKDEIQTFDYLLHPLNTMSLPPHLLQSHAALLHSGPQDPTRIHLLRLLHPAPAQQNPKPQAPHNMDHPRLGAQDPSVRRLLPRSQPSKSALQLLQGALHWRQNGSGGGGSQADRSIGFHRHGPGAIAAVGCAGGLPSPPFDDGSFDFEFSNVFDHALYLEKFVGEIERTLRPGGVCVLHVALSRRSDKYSANDLFSVEPLKKLFKRSELVRVRTVDGFGLDTELVFRKTRLSFLN